jgi:WD40 repeat protein
MLHHFDMDQRSMHSGMHLTPMKGLWHPHNCLSCILCARQCFEQGWKVKQSLLRRCVWARMWARSDNHLASLHEGLGHMIDEPYTDGSKRSSAAQLIGVRLLEVLVLSRTNSIVDMCLSHGRSDDDVWSMVATSSHALRAAKERAVGALHEAAAADIPVDTLAELVQPYLGSTANNSVRAEHADSPGPSNSRDSRESVPPAAAALRKAIMGSDDRVQRDMHSIALGLLSYSTCAPEQQQQQGPRLMLGRIEVVLSHKGEVLRSLCVRSDETVAAVCSSRCIREAKCRPDASSFIGACHDGTMMAAAASLSAPALATHTHAMDGSPAAGVTGGTPQQDRGERSRDRMPSSSRDLADDDTSSHSQQNQNPSLSSALDSLVDMLWQAASSHAAEVVHLSSSSDHPALGSATSFTGAMALATHPWLPVFVSGGADGAVLLHGFGAPQPLSSFGTLSGASSAAAISRMRFDAVGAKFCGGDTAGVAGVWNFELARGGAGGGQDRRPVDVIQAHARRCYDVCFLDKGTRLLTAGTGSSPTVCAWDLLMPPHCACIGAVDVHDGAANSACHLPRGNMVVSGGQKGDLCVIDTRTWRCLHTLPAVHRQAVRSLCVSPSGDLLASGSTDGDIKVWDVQDLLGGAGDAACVRTWSAAHEKVSKTAHTFAHGGFLWAWCSNHVNEPHVCTRWFSVGMVLESCE